MTEAEAGRSAREYAAGILAEILAEPADAADAAILAMRERINPELAELRAENVRLRAELAAAMAGKLARKPRAARKVPASAWPGRRAMVDDPEAGFVAADYLAAGRAGWRAPGPSALDSWMTGVPIPGHRVAAGWVPMVANLTGFSGESHHYGQPAYRLDDDHRLQNSTVAGWVESAAYHQDVCVPAMAAAGAAQAAASAAYRAAQAAQS
jgi:hypothetical protein